MKCAYDVHIHSCASPCASDDMTPANIAGMAKLKGLSIISLTDHNCGGNLSAMEKASKDNGLIFVPGVEVTTIEEIHMLSYFSALSLALQYADLIYNSLPNIPIKPEIFGSQLLIDETDKICGSIDKLLLQATPFSIEQIVDMTNQLGGCAVPAHINRESFSLLSNLGYIPDNLFHHLEICRSLPCPSLSSEFNILYSSDAHYLGDISEPVNIISGVSNANDFILYLKKEH